MNDTIRGLPNGDFEVPRAPKVHSFRAFSRVLSNAEMERLYADPLAPMDGEIAQPAPTESIFDWRTWAGGEMPVPHGTLIDVEYRNGEVRAVRAGDKSSNHWLHEGNWSHDIVRYRLRQPPAAAAELPTAQATRADPVLKTPKHSHYFKDVAKLQTIDVYRTLSLFSVVDPCLQHAVKKLLVAGGRGGGKDISRDIQEAIDTLVRWQAMRAEEVAS